MFWNFTCDGTFAKGQELETMLVRHEDEFGLKHTLTFIESSYLDNLTADGEVNFIRKALGKLRYGICIGLCVDEPSKHTGCHKGVVTQLGMEESSVICTPHTGDLSKQHLSKSILEIREAVALFKGIANDLNDFYKKKSYIKNTRSLNVKDLEYLTFPDTRWTYLAQASKRHIQVLPVLIATYLGPSF